ncbi:MAG: modA [Candidatus Sulfotelmatobacter sp.]|nr:modA [Candidatus Sulfotelmatobacter sp.]
MKLFEQAMRTRALEIFKYAEKCFHPCGIVTPMEFFHYQYAKGKIVVWVPKDFTINMNSGLKVLLDPRVKKIVIANPLRAPHGQRAVSAMQKEGTYDQAKDKFVPGENISQTASFVVSGSVDIGVGALSLALSPNMKDKGRYAEIPADEYPPIEQACVILSSSKNNEIAQQFLSYFKSATVGDLLGGYGFDVSGRANK